MTTPSRFQIKHDIGLPDIQDFAEFGQALRAMSNDDQTHKLSDGMGELSRAIERVGKALSSHQRGATVGPLLVDLLTALRKHRQLVVGLGESRLSCFQALKLLKSQYLPSRVNISLMHQAFYFYFWFSVPSGREATA